jgi:hypothetical protein
MFKAQVPWSLLQLFQLLTKSTNSTKFFKMGQYKDEGKWRIIWRPIEGQYRRRIKIHTMSSHIHHDSTTKIILPGSYYSLCHPPILWYAHIFPSSKLKNPCMLKSKFVFVHVVNLKLFRILLLPNYDFNWFFLHKLSCSTHLTHE